MREYLVSWGKLTRLTRSEREAAAALDEAAKSGQWAVLVAPPEALNFDPDLLPWDEGYEHVPYLEIGVGHPERSYAYWYGGPEGGFADEEPALPPWPAGVEEIWFALENGEPMFGSPDRACVSTRSARAAALEFVRTGQRPTVLTWGQAAAP